MTQPAAPDPAPMPARPTQIPYITIIAVISCGILVGFALVTYWVISADIATDPQLGVLKGSLIQTWNNLAVAAAGFWLASSLGGKMAATGTTPERNSS